MKENDRIEMFLFHSIILNKNLPALEEWPFLLLIPTQNNYLKIQFAAQ